MSSHDDSQPTRADALERAFPVTSADRARFWAGMNRFLETESADADTWAPDPSHSMVLRRTADDDA